MIMLPQSYSSINILKTNNALLEYIATKTIADNARTVRVPLNATALAIIEKYKDYDKTRLLPFISSQKYNDYIKVVLTWIARVISIEIGSNKHQQQE